MSRLVLSGNRRNIKLIYTPIAFSVALVCQPMSFAADQQENAKLALTKVGSKADVKKVGVITDISKEDLDAIQPNTLKDIFSIDSSISVGGSIPMNQKLYLRGIEETALQVTIDGARQNNKVFHHSATTIIDPALLKSVRAYSGVAPAEAGPGAIGGSIAFETIDVIDVLRPKESIGGFVNASFDSDSSTFITAGSIYGQNNGFEILAFVNKASGDDYSDGNSDKVEYSQAALLSGLGKLAYQTDELGRIELSYETVNDSSDRPYRANLSGITVGRPTPSSREYDLTRNNIVFSYNHFTGTGLWNPNVVIADSKTELTTTEEPLAAPGTFVAYTGITESASLKLENTFFIDIADITAGLDYYDDTATLEDTLSVSEKAKNTGAFVQLRQEFFDSLLLSYGVRFDMQDFEGIDGNSDDLSGTSTNISADYTLNEYLSFNVGYANVWGGVALAENFILNSGWDYSKGVKAVESSNYIVGFSTNYEGFNFAFDKYKTTIDNGRTPSWRGGPSQYKNLYVDGYDITVGYQVENDYLTIKYSIIDAMEEYLMADGTMDYRPITSYTGNYFATPLGDLIAINGLTTFNDINLSLGATIQVTLDNKSVVVTEGPELQQKQSGYTVIDIFADYQALPALNLRLTINNLLDEAYSDRASYGQEFETVKPVLEQGRSLLLSARYTF